MHKLLALLLFIYLFSSCKEEEKTHQPTPFSNVSANIRPLIHGVGSKWIYQNDNGHLDSAMTSSIDSNTTHFMSSKGSYTDMKVISLNYWTALSFHKRFVLRANIVSSYYDTNCFICYEALLFTPPSLNPGDTTCYTDQCSSLIEIHDTLSLNGNDFYNVIHYWNEDAGDYWWDINIGVIKHRNSNQTWTLKEWDLVD